MDNKEKSGEKMFQGAFPFDFGKFEKMAEVMKGCCSGEGGLADCCSIMKRMMEKFGEGEETRKQDAGGSDSTAQK